MFLAVKKTENQERKLYFSIEIKNLKKILDKYSEYDIVIKIQI